tara:strand:+ start:1234 stop:1731 length:498 start_codon:yes stop_codon:yes gene_type:complete
MAITLQVKRLHGDQFTTDDLLETKFVYTDVGTMYESLTTVEVISGVDVTHGGGAESDSYLHYKSVEDDADADGYIDYSTQIVQVAQVEKGDSVIKVAIKYVSVADHNTWVSDMSTWSDAYETVTVLADGTQERDTADGAPSQPTRAYTVIKSGEVALKWADDTFV